MQPVLAPDERLLVQPVRRARLRPGDLVVVRDPRSRRRRMVKRIALLEGRRAWVVGDNPAASTDSATFGWVSLPLLVARPVYRYSPADRAGRLDARLSATRPATADAPGGSPSGIAR